MRVIKQKIAITRKPHRCLTCLRLFPSGTRMEVQTVDNDIIYTVYLCDTCQQLLSDFKGSFCDSEGTFPEGCVCEVMPEFDCNTPEELLDFLKGVGIVG